MLKQTLKQLKQMNKKLKQKTEAKQLIFLFLMTALILLIGIFALALLSSGHTTTVVEQHMACTNFGNTDMSISTWQMLGNLK